ncbi:TatD family hydrolase [Sansalvadorimonas sp. 2012CJ34-2]|uniref:TatD family hydrolase n=1 Tax=Parendozoicomonas callyspongiae TaxID=2942213 RepID=A0ABT0PEW1_9GAMM|nr:TatD family hydrolase [Sansalvadorimonas sp. 2012CJ34-2]MCL6269915.1 TatD family hydrolase [Sansalvadorimonas sp. 2012CJ34-2]
MLFDSHCHLDFPAFNEDRDDLLQQCFAGGIGHICIPATEQKHWNRLENLLGSHSSGVNIWGAMGLHPYFLASHKDEYLEELDNRLDNKPDNIVAVGEAGLDLHIDNPNLPRQQELLAAQILIAAHHNLPLILHVRKAHDQTASLLRRLKFQEGGIVHAWSGSDQQAEAFARLGFKLGIGGSLTYERAKRLRRQVTELPLDYFVLETDAPDIPLAGLQGQRNSPLTVQEVFSVMASLRNIGPEELKQSLFKNTLDALHIANP